MRRLPQTSGYSYLRAAAIRINVHPSGENPINMICTLPTGGPRTWQYSTSRQQGWTESLLLRKRVPDTIPNTPADRSTGPYPVSLPSQPIKQWRKPNTHQQQATRFTGLISPACDRYVQYFLMGANRMVFNRHRRGLQS
jgi:hypothetical protein